MPLEGLKGKRALVTGAASGIGSAVVERLKREGVEVLATDTLVSSTPPHSSTSPAATNAEPVRRGKSPSPTDTSNGRAISSVQLTTCDSPRNDDKPIGIRKTPNSANRARRVLRRAGTEGKGWYLGEMDLTHTLPVCALAFP